MKILAIDSSGLVASVAVVTEEKLLAEYTVNNKKTHSQTLLPMLDDMMKLLEQDLKELDAIAVAGGPGSFTGLRIGSSTAKGLGLALDKPIINVPTVDALAYNLYGTDRLICPIMDARRNQVYTGIYEFQGEEFVVVTPQKAVGITDIAAELNHLGREVIFIGDGVEVHEAKLKEIMTVPFSFAPVHLSKQRAGAVGALGIIYYKKGLKENADAHEPVYLRLSQAERELMEKERAQKE
ncbi:tRNA (adenosine(37)-N6)-threonylcarbamoyltransferase complex dimerization subunit type 1 TsaB [Anaerocolumna sedimenticola]|uniref:tRNA (Adenosine(37)-N6)-threonylcarbamoyltransferase complex dimerization subunit type 1 TsaB n=1 Tax=Anaerocolumna sedimenticola TaxID=2696063 RepID=A0A6P1THL4_9FIRM|nr:tRNA (adenosine(37)-N6)-threonylcarbamoyltransferase complex dimerization subunit type 1 TsaB [Anaerocolumna sedimenticola]QHQ59923.1 tRNA (adenosine(37)-N6)-threonylcarbamoyltransferase complex dimerization subunit type 1 TsaB [Anaerocolumna sedimenticola]